MSCLLKLPPQSGLSEVHIKSLYVKSAKLTPVVSLEVLGADPAFYPATLLVLFGGEIFEMYSSSRRILFQAKSVYWRSFKLS